MIDYSPRPLKYPLLMLHGFGFRDDRKFSYWGRIPKLLSDKGCKLFYGEQDSCATVEDNAVHLKSKLEEILSVTGAEKVNIIAHSKGGLEARYLISSLGMEDKVASLTTIGSPHRGSRTIEKVPDFVLKMVAFFVNVWMKKIGDKHPDSYKSFLSFRSDSAEVFNRENPDSDKVYYQSYAFVMRHDFLLWFPHLVINRCEGANDGLVTVTSAEWGDFKGVVKCNSRKGISHGDEIDMRRRSFTEKSGDGISDILEIYAEIADTLYRKGF